MTGRKGDDSTESAMVYLPSQAGRITLTLMLRPFRGMRCSQDLDVGCRSLGLGGGVSGALCLCLTTANSYQITPERHLSLARWMSIEMPRFASTVRSQSSCGVVEALQQHVSICVATALAVFDRRKYTTEPSQTTRVLCRSSRQQLPSPQ
jgi:hypothetical protein